MEKPDFEMLRSVLTDPKTFFDFTILRIFTIWFDETFNKPNRQVSQLFYFILFIYILFASISASLITEMHW